MKTEALYPTCLLLLLAFSQNAWACRQPVCTTVSVCGNTDHLGGPHCHDELRCNPGTCGTSEDLLSDSLEPKQTDSVVLNHVQVSRIAGLSVTDDTGRVKVGENCGHSVAGPFCTDVYQGGTIYWLKPTARVSQSQLDNSEDHTVDITGSWTSDDTGGSPYFGYNPIFLHVENLTVY